ncbi:MAG: AMP-binding protein [Mariprofundaceae bacterium]|nr:AMP-binding protein [Mariprofundaceae bacterium]
MSLILKAVTEHAFSHADTVAIQGSDSHLTYAQLIEFMDHAAQLLQFQKATRVAILMDNTPAVLLVDLACIQCATSVIPVPLFFSPSQVQHALQSSSADFFISNLGDAAENTLQLSGVDYEVLPGWELAGESLQVYRLRPSLCQDLPLGVQKITYTSGSTGDAKGVCLSQDLMDDVALSLLKATHACQDDRHLCLLPYATLLENIAGMYVPLLAGATVCLPGLENIGMQGSSGLDIDRFTGALLKSKATSCVMIPQMLQALLAGIKLGIPKPADLRYIAVGGAPVSEHLLAQAAQLNLPVYEGYGLSEAASVVALNTLEYNKRGSVGRVLPHVQICFADDGEILLKGAFFSGYLGDPTNEDAVWATGDIGHLDDDGFLYIKGRKKHIFITSFGRNVSPEWVERELNIEAAIAQSCVFGEARSFNVAVVCVRQGFDAENLKAAFESANQRLPDYAQVHHWLVVDQPFSIANGQWTGTGRPRRTFIERHYHQGLLDIYKKEYGGKYEFL